MDNKRRGAVFAFLVVEAALYYVVMAKSGTVVWVSQFSSVVFCFAFSLLGVKEKNCFIPLGLAFTVVADYFLVAHHPQLRLWGMLFFLGTQCVYAVLLHKENTGKGFLWFRVGLCTLSLVVCLGVLGSGADALAIVSLGYYANLLTNILMAFCRFGKRRLFAVGLVLFLLCDTVVGLQVAGEGYLPIEEGSFLYRVIFPSFNLPWLFYLPSQVLIALSAVKARKDYT